MLGINRDINRVLIKSTNAISVSRRKCIAAICLLFFLRRNTRLDFLSSLIREAARLLYIRGTTCRDHLIPFGTMLPECTWGFQGVALNWAQMGSRSVRRLKIVEMTFGGAAIHSSSRLMARPGILVYLSLPDHYHYRSPVFN